jgi:hypothetical protein
MRWLQSMPAEKSIVCVQGPLMVSQKYKKLESLGLVKCADARPALPVGPLGSPRSDAFVSVLPYTIKGDITLRDIARRFGSR